MPRCPDQESDEPYRNDNEKEEEQVEYCPSPLIGAVVKEFPIKNAILVAHSWCP